MTRQAALRYIEKGFGALAPPIALLAVFLLAETPPGVEIAPLRGSEAITIVGLFVLTLLLAGLYLIAKGLHGLLGAGSWVAVTGEGLVFVDRPGRTRLAPWDTYREVVVDGRDVMLEHTARAKDGLLDVTVLVTDEPERVAEACRARLGVEGAPPQTP